MTGFFVNFNYNFLNLVGGVKAGGQTVAEYRWLADGTKVGVMGYGSEGFTEGGFEYLGSLVYTRDADGELRLESASFGGGRFKVSESSEGDFYTPNYFLTDHLGSTRVVAAFGGDGIDILDRSDYYPYGLRCEYPEAQASDNRWLYNGKELQIAGLPDAVKYLDYGWRMYDPKLVRMKTVDLMTEDFPEWSPFNYALNNPIAYIDLFGLRAQRHDDKPEKDPEPIVLEEIVVPAHNPPSVGDRVMRPLSGFWDYFIHYTGGRTYSYEYNTVNIFNRAVTRTINYDVDKDGYITRVTPIGGVAPAGKLKGLGKINPPKGWIKKPAKGDGIKFTDPKNNHNSIRVMKGNPQASKPGQRQPYVKYQKDGSFYDMNGNKLPSGDCFESHIPLDKFNQNIMPPFK